MNWLSFALGFASATILLAIGFKIRASMFGPDGWAGPWPPPPHQTELQRLMELGALNIDGPSSHSRRSPDPAGSDSPRSDREPPRSAE